MVGILIATYVWIVCKTSRWQVLNGEYASRMLSEEKPFILAFWHGRLLMIPPFVRRKHSINVLISQHRDGEIIARSLGHWDLKTIRGSTGKSALQAMKQMLRSLKQGEVAVITPDGPGGPRMRVQKGIVRLAAMSGLPVIPITFSTNRGRFLQSWDRFLVAFPFSRGVIAWGNPIHIEKKADDARQEEMRLEIENSMNALTQQADIQCGQGPILPDAADALPKKLRKKAAS
jgi:lysophospholipid acyltransferase (LPLAT)-like uncharacterized protein